VTAFALWIHDNWLTVAAVGVFGGVVALWGLMAPSLIRERRNEAAFDELLNDLIDAPLYARASILSESGLSERDKARVAGLAEIADLVWLAGQTAPPIEQDPLAKRLGIVPDSAEGADHG
jgi:hypothetical protein